MPCTACFRAQRLCRFAEGSARCGECIRKKVRCDGLDFAESLTRSLDELQRLHEEEEALADQMIQLNRKFMLVVAQRRRTKARADELFKRGTLIVESDPASFSGETEAVAGDPFSSEVAPVSDFGWSSLDSTLFDRIGCGPIVDTAAGDPSGGSPKPSATAP